MTETEVNEKIDPKILEKVLGTGDLASLTPQQRVDYYNAVCRSTGLNPLTRPFEFTEIDGKVLLYAKKDATDQLRKIYDVTIHIVSRAAEDNVYSVIARATLPNKREDESIGAAPLAKEGGEWKQSQSGKKFFAGNGTMVPLSPEARANQYMRVETKAKRRVTLSVCGLGMLDESEIEDIREASARAMGLGDDDAVEKAAEEDPRLRVGVKQIEATPAAEVIDLPPQKEKAPANLSPTEERTEANLKRAKEKKAPKEPEPKPTPAPVATNGNQAKYEASDDDLPWAQEVTDQPPPQPLTEEQERDNFKARLAAVIPGDDVQPDDKKKVLTFIHKFVGPNEQLPWAEKIKLFNGALDAIEKAAKDPAQFALLRDNPEALATKLKGNGTAPPPAPAPANDKTDPLAEEFGWSPGLCGTARMVMKARNLKSGQFVEVLRKHFRDLPEDDVAAGLLLYEAHPDTLELLADRGTRTVRQVHSLVNFHMSDGRTLGRKPTNDTAEEFNARIAEAVDKAREEMKLANAAKQQKEGAHATSTS